MSPYERLLAEELPTGRFGDASTRQAKRRKPAAKTGPQPDPNAAAHLAELAAAISTRTGRRAQPARHLHAVKPAA